LSSQPKEVDSSDNPSRRGLDASPEPDIAPLGHYVLADVYNRLGRPRDAEREAAAARRLERATAGS
jgi:hypothetical protein